MEEEKGEKEKKSETRIFADFTFKSKQCLAYLSIDFGVFFYFFNHFGHFLSIFWRSKRMAKDIAKNMRIAQQVIKDKID